MARPTGFNMKSLLPILIGCLLSLPVLAHHQGSDRRGADDDCVPEATDGMTTPVDPACEHRLLKGLKKNGFTIIELEHSNHAIPFGANGRPQGEAFEKSAWGCRTSKTIRSILSKRIIRSKTISRSCLTLSLETAPTMWSSATVPPWDR